jgi:hypothetical protein
MGTWVTHPRDTIGTREVLFALSCYATERSLVVSKSQCADTCLHGGIRMPKADLQ